MTAVLIALAAAAAAYTLEPFTLHNNNLERANASKAKARGGTYDPHASIHWVPQVSDDTAEAYRASRTFSTDRKASLEFVHVHKCGGMTFNRVAPKFVCGTSNCRNGTCCVVRPHDPSLYDLAYRPRYGSAFEELDGFRLPWGQHVYKAAMAREPFSRYRSEVGFECSYKRAGRPPAYPEALRLPYWRWHAQRNRISQGLVHGAVLGDSGRTGAAFTGLRRDVMENGLRAFAFLGIVEAYDASLCLLARTVSPQSVCGACCAHNTHPVVNGNKNTSCVAPSTKEDETLYASTHTADGQVYEVVKRIFEERWRRAMREGWGATPEKCGCAFVAGPCLRDAYGRCVPPDCESYHDGCNTCSIHEGRLDACTEMFCEAPKEPRCLDTIVGGPTGDKEQDNCCGGGSACGYVLVEGKCVHASSCLRDAYGRCVPDDCASYFDGCNTCSVGAEGLGCTLMYCETPSEARCLDEKKPSIPLWVVGAVLLAAPIWCVFAVPVLACLGNCLWGDWPKLAARRRRVPER